MRICFLITAGLLFQSLVHARQLTQQAVKTRITSYGEVYQNEKLYIQFDKPAYAPGETIWFKAYLLKNSEEGSLSKSLYIDFADNNGKVLLHAVYPVNMSSAQGNFDVPAAYKDKNIHIQAYTKWMLNFDSAFLYTKDIRVIQPLPVTANAPKPQPLQAADIQFFAEGGDYITGLPAKIAFKANYKNGVPCAATGIIVNNKGETVDTITTMHDGMGYFTLTAQPGETYTAQWKDAENNSNQTPLPAAKSEGVSLEIKAGKRSVGFVVKKSDNAPAGYNQMHIVATMQRDIVYMAPIDLEKINVTGGGIPVTNLQAGILQVTLFNAAWQPVAERITYIHDTGYSFKPAIKFDTLALAHRGKNVLTVTVPDSIEANMSIAITDAGAGVDSTDDIISRMLLTGDLKGRVYHPGYYFSNNSDSVFEHLDLVMLTNGWRRFKWNDVLASNVPVPLYAADTAYLTLGGKVEGLKPEKIKEAGGLFVIASGTKDADTTKDFFTIPLNADGTFTQPGYSFIDTLKIFYQFASKKGNRFNTDATVTFTSGALAPPQKIPFNNSSLSYSYLDTAGNYFTARLAAEEARLAELLKQTTLKNVTVTARVKRPIEILDDRYTDGLFKGGDAAAQFDMTTDIAAKSATNVFLFLASRVPGLEIRNPGTDRVSLFWRNQPTTVFIDGMRVEPFVANTLFVPDIAYIKAMRPPFVGNPGNLGGAVAIYTRKGADMAPDPFGHTPTYKTVAGYTYTKEFYSPNYSITDTMAARADVRPTLYWNPWLLTTVSGHTIRLPFYNNDITKKIRIIIEGVSSDGQLTRIEKIVE